METKAHKKRVAQALKDNATGKVPENSESTETSQILNEEQVNEEIQEEEKKTKTKKNGHNSLFIKERLRKKLQERNQKEEENKIQKSVNETLSGKSESVSKPTKLDENMQKLSELLEKSKAQSA